MGWVMRVKDELDIRVTGKRWSTRGDEMLCKGQLLNLETSLKGPVEMTQMPEGSFPVVGIMKEIFYGV